MNISSFLDNDNIKILRDVIFDEDIIKKQSREFQENIYNLFKSNISGFFEVESNKTSNLVDINKKYILLILNYANKLIQNSVSSEFKKNKILDEIPKNVNELITYEEIQNDKRSQFEQDLNKRQDEFSSAMTLPVPPIPKFSDTLDDGPITELEKSIKELTAQRNYDVEQINRNNNNNITNSNADNWLKSKETSVKIDKIKQPVQGNNGNNFNNGNKLKYIKIEDTDIDNNIYKNQIIDLGKKLPLSPKKSVTWDKNEVKEIKLTIEEIEEIEENNNDTNSDINNDNNIFKLLKMVPNVKKENLTSEDKITVLQKEVKSLNNKLDLILDLLKNNNK